MAQTGTGRRALEKPRVLTWSTEKKGGVGLTVGADGRSGEQGWQIGKNLENKAEHFELSF